MSEDSTRPAFQILVVEDDENLRRLIAAYLEKEGFVVSQAADGRAALAQLRENLPDLIVLDLMLPGLSGIHVARQVRERGDTPVLMLTARGDEEDILEGFEVGADDYVVKPFSPKVLVARVRAILRRVGTEARGSDAEAVNVGDLSIDLRAREVRVDGREVELTTTEFDLLRVLADHPGWVYSREELLEAVWGYSYLGDSRLVDVHVANLRRKIGDDPQNPRFIHTVRGAGYKLNPATGV